MFKSGSLKKVFLFVCGAATILTACPLSSAHAAVANIALNKSYSSSVPASGDYPDTNSAELTDGAYGTENFKDAQWQGRQNVKSYTQTVNLGEESYLTDVSCRFLQQTGCAIYFPAQVAFSCSDDGTDFAPMGTASAASVSSAINQYKLTLSNAVRAKYIKMTVTTSGEWTFEDELEANGISDPPLNIAQTKKYTVSSPADSDYPDTMQRELTDGKFASDSFTDPGWQGRLGSFSVTLDLETKMRVTGMDMNFLQYEGGGVNLPANVSFECSDDGSTFTALGDASPQAGGNSTEKFNLALSAPVNTRYIKVNITASDPNAWIFADELEVFGHPIISGSFIQLSYGDIWQEADWEQEFGYMKDLGMDHVILQWIVDFSPKEKAVYYTSPNYNASTGYENRNKQDTLLNVLTAAKKQGIDVWVGLGADDDWWSNSTNQSWLTAEAQKNVSVIKEIWDSPVGYKNIGSLKGWYNPWEVDNDTFKASADQTNLRAALKTVVDYAHSYTGKPIMTSPYVGGRSTGLSPDGWTSMWTYLLDPTAGANFDVVAPQDSFGTLANTYFPAMRKAVDTNPNCELWANLETYDPNVGCAEPTITMLNQLNTEIPYVSKMTSFSYLHYHSPKVVGWAENEDWKRVIYPRIGKTYTGPVMGYADQAAGKSYTASVPADSAYPDTNGKELTNKKYAGSVSYLEDHYQGRKNVSSYQFVVDLQKQTSFTSTILNFIQQSDQNVFFPQSVTYSVSTDGTNYSPIGTVNKPNTTLDASANHYELDLNTPVTARYVKAVVTTGTSGWTFCDEMEVIGQN